MARGARFESDRILLDGYPFLASTRVIPAHDIAQALPHWFPPAVQTTSGEFLFLESTGAAELVAFAESHSLSVVSRVDVWSQILEPFLDTELSDRDRERIATELEVNGVSAVEAEKMRALVRRRMWVLTFTTWEWQHYGLYDVLSVMKPFSWITGWTFSRFYAHAMTLATRGRVR